MSEEETPAVEAEEQGPHGAEQFSRDPRTEKVLSDNNLRFDFAEVALEEIDLSALDGGNPEAQMRDEIIHMDVAHRYADDLSWGTVFPAGVLSRQGSTYRIVDFHHRLWAARAAKLTHVSAYVVPDLDDFNLVEAGNLLNRNHGVPLSEHERIRQAMWGLDIGRFKTVRQAARTLGIPEATVARARRIAEAKHLAHEVGVSEVAFGKLPKASQERLGSIDSPEVFKVAAENVINRGLGTVEVNELVTKVNEVGGDVAKIEVVKAFTADVEPKRPVANLADPLTRVHAACRSILGIVIDREFDLSVGRRPVSELASLQAEFAEVAEKLGSLRRKLEHLAPEADSPAANVS